jgi:hypothetical protein
MNNLVKIILIILVLNFMFKKNRVEKFSDVNAEKLPENNCYHTCKTCGDYGDERDCTSCKDDFKHYQIYEDGTGVCIPKCFKTDNADILSQDEADKLNEKELYHRLILHKIENCSKDTDCVYGGCDKEIGKCYNLPCQNHSDCSFDNGVQTGFCNKSNSESHGYCAPFDKNDCDDLYLLQQGGDKHAKCRNKKGETNKCLRYWRGQWTTDNVYNNKCVSNSEYEDAESKRGNSCTTWGAIYLNQCGKNLQCKSDPTSSDAINGTCN